MRATLPFLLLSACSGSTGNDQAAPAASASSAAASFTPRTVNTTTNTSVTASKVEEKTADFTFSYAYPPISVARLTAWLDRDRSAARAEIAKEASDGRRESADGSFPFHPYDSTTEWKIVTETPRFLSLSAETYVFTGGAHGSPGFRAVLWDKAQGTRLDPAAVFTSTAALQAAIGHAFCAALDSQRSQRRGTPVVRSADDPFSQCPKVAETTVILGSSNRRSVDRIGLLVGPYVAGPYAEGSYDLTIPVTTAVIGALKPAYRDAFTR